MRIKYPGKYYIESKMEGDEDLLLWQRACFIERQNPRSVADSLRVRVGLLDYSYRKK